MDEINIPRYIDDQQQFFFWELDEAAVAITLFGVGIVAESIFFSFIMIVLISMQLRRFKNNTLPGTLLHIAFWNGLTGLNREYPDAFERELHA